MEKPLQLDAYKPKDIEELEKYGQEIISNEKYKDRFENLVRELVD